MNDKMLKNKEVLDTVKKLQIFLDLFHMQAEFQEDREGLIVDSVDHTKVFGNVLLTNHNLKTDFVCEQGSVTSKCLLESTNFPFQIDSPYIGTIRGLIRYFTQPNYQMSGFRIERLSNGRIVQHLQLFDANNCFFYDNKEQEEKKLVRVSSMSDTGNYLFQVCRGEQLIEAYFNRQITDLTLVENQQSVSTRSYMEQIYLGDSVWNQLMSFIEMVYPDFYRMIQSEIDSYEQGNQNFIKEAIQKLAIRRMSEGMRTSIFGKTFVKKPSNFSFNGNI